MSILFVFYKKFSLLHITLFDIDHSESNDTNDDDDDDLTDDVPFILELGSNPLNNQIRLGSLGDWEKHTRVNNR
jgi:hypothetical protein